MNSPLQVYSSAKGLALQGKRTHHGFGLFSITKTKLSLGVWNKTWSVPESPAAGSLPPGRAPSCRYTLMEERCSSTSYDTPFRGVGSGLTGPSHIFFVVFYVRRQMQIYRATGT